MKNVQIPEELLFQLFRYHLLGSDDQELLTSITKGLQEKLDKMVKHQLYSESKTADTEEERNAARKKYLDAIGMHPDFRW